MTADMTCDSKQRGESTNSDRDKLDIEFLDFQLSRAHASAWEAGKRLRHSYLLSLLFLLLGAILVLGKGVEQQIAVPILGLRLERLYAAEVAILLCCASLYSVFSAMTAQRLLHMKIHDLMVQRYGVASSQWHLYYPSILLTPTLQRLVSSWGSVIEYVQVFVILALVFAPIGLVLKVASDSSWAAHAIVALVAVCALLVLCAITLFGIPSVGSDRAEVLKKLEGSRDFTPSNSIDGDEE